MKTRALALMLALGLLAGGTATTAQEKGKAAAPQDKKKDDKKKDDKAERKDDKKESAVGTIEVYKGKNGFRYRIKNADGKTVAMPLAQMSWESREDCLKAIDEVKATLNKAKPVDVKE